MEQTNEQTAVIIKPNPIKSEIWMTEENVEEEKTDDHNPQS